MAPNTPLHSRGAEWRKWDLHVHSPASATFNGDWPGFVIQLGNSDCAVIGINDYFSVAGYKELRAKLADPHEGADGNKAYREALGKLKSKTLLPVVECRMTNVVLGKKSSGTRINFHIIFSDEVNPDDIETLIKGWMVKDKSIGSRYADSKFLLDEVAVDFNAVLKQLQGDETFKDKFVIWIPYDEYGGIDPIDPKTNKLFKEGLVKNADILGSSDRKQADFFLWKDSRYTPEQYKAWFGTRKPCIKGSDSHDANDEIGRLKDQDSKPIDRWCWIKADPTFKGLRQTIHEPEDRVFIGAVPPKLERIRDNKTCFVSRIRIGKTKTANIADTWFDCDMPLNHDMVAIIGNKGSGKSALADIIALCGDTSRCEDFSFLEKKKFREKRLASNFEVKATWEDGTETTHNLQDDPDANRPETIRYIPQTYLEKVCTETSVDEESAFQHELRKVIFSHITDAQRLGKDTLEELITYKTEEIDAELARHKQELSQVNIEIANLQQKATPDYRRQIEEALNEKKKELQAHDTNKPAEVPKAVVAKLEGRLTNLERDVTAQIKQSAPQFAELGLDVSQIISLTINRAPLTVRKTEVVAAKAKVDASLSQDNPDGLLGKRKVITDKISALRNQLDAPSKRYQAYLQQLRDWEARKSEIEGSADVVGTLRHFEELLKYIGERLPEEIANAKSRRYGLAEKIHNCISQIRDVYVQLFAPVQDLIQNSIVIKEGFKLSFVSSIVQRGFGTDFFDQHISQGVNGSF